jgi:hypothetical protein
MRDAPLVPLMWENHPFHWASRVHGWVYDPWAATTDFTASWLAPQPLTAPSAQDASARPPRRPRRQLPGALLQRAARVALRPRPTCSAAHAATQLIQPADTSHEALPLTTSSSRVTALAITDDAPPLAYAQAEIV